MGNTGYMSILLFATSGAAVAISQVILDASNLQLGLRPGLSNLGLSSLDVPRLHERMDVMVRALDGDAADVDASAASTTALFDGGAFDSKYANARWDCDPESPGAAPVAVCFTDVRVSADDAVVAFAEEVGSAADAPRAELVTTGHARSLLEAGLDSPPPVFAATLLKSAMGKGKRDKREAFLRTCGLTKMGDTVHLPCFDATQRARALALIRGLHAIERGVIRIEMLSKPAALVVSDDRGLRRRCFTLGHPPVVLGRRQWENWLLRCELPAVDL